TPLQALVLLNDPVYVEASEALAERIMDQYPGDIERGIGESLQLITAVPPQREKTAALISLYRESLSYYGKENEVAEGLKNEKDRQRAALAIVANVMLNLDEFVTRR
ncbi:MAG TPA: DUF1553 domain-containing protein, partial [Anseongella sp.]|nr:DUF1553 domain-containing protein [Anseongella sp.]